MAENSKIEWTHHTMNFWQGCTALSPACDHCYAESWAKRTGNARLWQGERRRSSAALWRQPLKWDAACAAAGIRQRVFTNSLADFFDNQVPAEWRHDAWDVILTTRHLDWMLLTKRPENIAKMLPGPALGTPAWGDGWPNVWLGTTIEDRARLRRLDHLRRVPAAVRFLSCEPLLEDLGEVDLTGIHLVIVGGESGPGARPVNPAWVRSLRDQCEAQCSAFFFKQWGDWAPFATTAIYETGKIGGDCGGPGPIIYAGRKAGQNPKVTLRDGSEVRAEVREEPTHRWGPNGSLRMTYIRVGKKAAGRLLDGRLHDAMPEGRRP